MFLLVPARVKRPLNGSVCVCVTSFSGKIGRSQYGQMHIEQKLQNAEQLVACSGVFALYKYVIPVPAVTCNF